MTSTRGPEKIPFRARSRSLDPSVLIDGTAAPLRVLARRARPWDRWLAGSRGLTLDAELAAGSSADDTRLRAVRADVLVSPSNRGRLAGQWESLVDRAHRSRGITDPRLPLARRRVLAAECDILAMAAALRSPLPVPARGVAMASVLLSDGAGPVFSRRSRVDLVTAVRAATRHLDPYAELTSAWQP